MKRSRSTLRKLAEISLDEQRKCVLGYIEHLPEVGWSGKRDVAREKVLVARVGELLDELRGLRARAHAEAFDNWSEDEIAEAIDQAKMA